MQHKRMAAGSAFARRPPIIPAHDSSANAAFSGFSPPYRTTGQTLARLFFFDFKSGNWFDNRTDGCYDFI